ncbi:amidase [Myxococcaceae bacterium]|jgi:aspartyl-tRNA(Asn)/glutamyl-tRNA(Gln) amidotransferase subunit A|nr:amidase [Myxococcaceae bacterium]
MTDLLHQPLVSVVDRLEQREISPVELLEATLERIEARNADLNAFVLLRDRDVLLGEARAAAERIARGEARPLEGVPLGVKDLEDVGGLVTSHGSVPFKDHVARCDSIQVERLRAAGCIVVGKTNAPEFGSTAITKNLLFGETRNPWNPAHTPGGSSGGTSAAIAAGMVPLATASDGGGSVRIPASFTGCFGLKPSLGRIPHGPDTHWVTVQTATHGPLTRCVEDAALHLDLVCGPHPLDPLSLPAPGFSYRERLRELPKRLRIAYSPDLGYAVVQRDVAEVVAEAALAFERLGHEVEIVSGGPPEMGRDWGMVNVFDMLARLHHLLPEREHEFGRSFIAGVKLGRQMTPERWEAAQRRREELGRWCADLFARFDLLLTPTVPYDPPPARGPFPTELDGKPLPEASVASFTIPFNLSWHPAATVRAGFSERGLPVGLQIVAPRHRDDLVLQAAYAFEASRPAPNWPDA